MLTEGQPILRNEPSLNVLSWTLLSLRRGLILFFTAALLLNVLSRRFLECSRALSLVVFAQRACPKDRKRWYRQSIHRSDQWSSLFAQDRQKSPAIVFTRCQAVHGLNDVGCRFRIPWRRVTSPLGTRMNFLTASEIGMRRGGENPADMSLPKFRADEKPIIPPRDSLLPHQNKLSSTSLVGFFLKSVSQVINGLLYNADGLRSQGAIAFKNIRNCLQNLDDSLSHGRIDDDYFINWDAAAAPFQLDPFIFRLVPVLSLFRLHTGWIMNRVCCLMLHTKQGGPDMLQGVNGVPPDSRSHRSVGRGAVFLLCPGEAQRPRRF